MLPVFLHLPTLEALVTITEFFASVSLSILILIEVVSVSAPLHRISYLSKLSCRSFHVVASGRITFLI